MGSDADGLFLFLFIIVAVVFKILISDDKNQRSQWRASSMMM